MDFDWIARAAAESGNSEALKKFPEKPHLPPWLIPLWEKYNSLSVSRQFGFNGPQPLQYSDVELAAANTLAFDPEVAGYLIRRLDAVYLKHFYDEQKKKDVKKGRR